MEKAIERLRQDPDVVLILLGGSIAKGIERPDSDVDLIAVVTDARYERCIAEQEVAFLWTDIADWEGGYLEGRYVSRSFVLQAAERGSEPTRWSFIGAKPVWGQDAEIEAAIPRIPVYPEFDRERRLDAFMAQVGVCRYYFWEEAVRRNDPYLRAWSGVQVVLFAARAVLAHDRVLFPNQKRLMETLAKCPSKPSDFDGLAERTLSGDGEACDALCQAMVALVGSRRTEGVPSRFQQDVEMSWFTGSHDVAEW